jgi:hypothetical protein
MFGLLKARLRIAARSRQGECVHDIIVSGVNNQKLACALSRYFTDRQAGCGKHRFDRRNGVTLGKSAEVDQTRVGYRNLEGFEAKLCGPTRDAAERIKRRLPSDELTDEQPRSLNGLWHGALLEV